MVGRTTPGDFGHIGMVQYHRRATTGGAAWRPGRSHLPPNDVTLEAGNRPEYVRLLLFGDFELIESANQVLDTFIPIRFADIEAGVCRLHVTAGVLARTSGGEAQEIDNMLANFDLRIGAQAGKESSQLRVGREMTNKIVSHGGQRVITTEPLIQTLLLGFNGLQRFGRRYWHDGRE